MSFTGPTTLGCHCPRRQIKAALDAKGVECVLRVYDDEGHGLAKRVNRLDAYPPAMAFLSRVLVTGSDGP